MTLTRNQLILIAVAAGLLLVVLIAGSIRGCGCQSPFGGTTIIAGGIDAGPGEAVIAGRLDGAVQAGEAHMVQIEQKFDEDLAAFDAAQRADYDRVRGGGDLEAAALMLSQWNVRRRDAGR